jgi:hypothetical protein
MRDLIATAFEVCGLLFGAAAAGVYAAEVSLPLGLAASAGALVVEGLVLAALEPKPAGDDE